MSLRFAETQLYSSLITAHKGLVVLGEIPWPSIQDDVWKYTDLSILGRSSFAPVEERDVRTKDVPEALKSFVAPAQINIVFYNGSYVPSLSSLSIEGIEIGLLNKAGADRISLQPSLFQAMNGICAPFSYVINVEAKIVEERVIHIVHWNDKGSGRKTLFPRVFISAGEMSKVKIMESFYTKENVPVVVNSMTDIQLGNRAAMEFVQIFHQSRESMQIGATCVHQEKGSSFRSFQFFGGAKILRNDLKVKLKGEEASASINGLHYLKGSDHADSQTLLEHVAPNTVSDQLYKAILNNNAHSVFNGRVFVRKEAQKTSAYQLNKNLLLSRTARVDTKPQLEIFADDVKCSHGSATGQMDEEELFYLQTRAISKESALKMLVKGFIDDVLSKVKDPMLLNEVLKAMA